MEDDNKEIIEEEKLPRPSKPAFFFPPRPEEKQVSSLSEIEKKPKSGSIFLEDDLEVVPLKRKPKAHIHDLKESKGNASTLSPRETAVLGSLPYESMRTEENRKSLQEDRGNPESPFDEFEEECRRNEPSRRNCEVLGKFLLRNMQLSGVQECPLRLETLSLGFMFEGRQTISIFYGNETFLCFGLENGVLLVYKPTDPNFCMILNPPNAEKATCIDVSEDNSRLLAGYSKASVCLFDLKNGRLLRKVSLCGNNSPLIFVRFSRIGANKTVIFLGNAEDRVCRVKLIDRKGISLKIGQQKLDIQPLNFYFKLKNVLNGFPALIPASEGGRKIELLAVSMTQKVLVIDLKNRKTAAFEFPRPSFVEPDLPPILYWDTLRSQGEGKQPILRVLMILWGNLIVMAGVSISGDNLTVKAIRHLVLHYSMCFAGLISESIILGVNNDKEKGAFMVNYAELQPGEFSQGGFHQSSKHLPRIHLCLSKDFFARNANSSGLSSQIPRKNCLFFIDETLALRKLVLQDWDLPIRTLKRTMDYKNAMKMTMEVARGGIRNLAGIPEVFIRDGKAKDLVEELTHDFFLKYYRAFLSFDATQKNPTSSKSSLGENSRDDIAMIMIIEFLVETEHFEYLFRRIYVDFKGIGKTSQFLECLEPFILTQRIRHVPEDTLDELISLYQEKGKPALIQTLILSLDLSKGAVDSSSALRICLRHDFYPALIYLCTESSNDFMIPLIKIFSTYLDRKAANPSTNDPLETNKIGYRALWYIEKCLKGTLINGKTVPQESMNNLIVDLTKWVFDESNLRNLILLDTKLAFGLLFRFFDDHGRVYFLLLKNQAKIQSKSARKSQLNALEKASSSSIFEDLVHRVVLVDDELARNEEAYREKRSHFYQLIAQVFEMSLCEVDKTVCLDCFFHLNDNPALLEPLRRGRPARDAENVRFLLDMLKYATNDEYDFAEDSRFRRAMNTSAFPQIKLHFNKRLRDYRRCFEIYLETRNEAVKLEFFDWFNEIIKRAVLSRPQLSYFEEMKQLFVLNISAFLRLSSDRTHELINSHFSDCDLEIIENLSQTEKLKTEYIEKRLRVRKSEKLKLLFLENLAKERNAKKILAFLAEEELPFEQSLEICERNGIKKAVVVLLPRTGKFEQSLDLHLEILKEKLDKWLRNRLHVPEGKITRFFEKKMREIEEMLDLHRKTDDLQTQELCVKCLESLIQVFSDLETQSSNDYLHLAFLLDTLGSKIRGVLDFMIKRIPFDILSQRLFEVSARVRNAEFVKYGFSELLSNAKFLANAVNCENRNLVELDHSFRALIHENSKIAALTARPRLRGRKRCLFSGAGMLYTGSASKPRPNVPFAQRQWWRKKPEVLSEISAFARQRQKLANLLHQADVIIAFEEKHETEVIPDADGLDFVRLEHSRTLRRKRQVQLLDFYEKKHAARLLSLQNY